MERQKNSMIIALGRKREQKQSVFVTTQLESSSCDFKHLLNGKIKYVFLLRSHASRTARLLCKIVFKKHLCLGKGRGYGREKFNQSTITLHTFSWILSVFFFFKEPNRSLLFNCLFPSSLAENFPEKSLTDRNSSCL